MIAEHRVIMGASSLFGAGLILGFHVGFAAALHRLGELDRPWPLLFAAPALLLLISGAANVAWGLRR